MTRHIGIIIAYIFCFLQHKMKSDNCVYDLEKMSVRVCACASSFLETPFNDLFAHAVSKCINKSL